MTPTPIPDGYALYAIAYVDSLKGGLAHYKIEAKDRGAMLAALVKKHGPLVADRYDVEAKLSMPPITKTGYGFVFIVGEDPDAAARRRGLEDAVKDGIGGVN
jgi:hypothetical protein